MNTVQRAIMAYMSTRCNVTSQHKLPSREELYNTVTIGLLFGRHQIDAAVDDLVSNKKLINYDGYISDRSINVL
jgi:hypothetical protein